MTAPLADFDTSIAECLESGAASVRARKPGRWKFTPHDAPSLSVEAKREGEWLLLRAFLPANRSFRPVKPDLLSRMLASNATLPGGVKFAISNSPKPLCLRAELILDEECADLQSRVSAACDGLSKAAQEFADGQVDLSSHHPSNELLREETPQEEFDPATLALVEGTGWPLSARLGNRLAVELEVPGTFCQALVRPVGETGLHLEVELPAVPSLGEAGRRAVESLLLSACGVVRMARATKVVTANATVYRWEVAMGHVVNIRELEHALAALSVACRLTIGEIGAFQEDEDLARSYLTFRGWCFLRVFQ